MEKQKAKKPEKKSNAISVRMLKSNSGPHGSFRKGGTYSAPDDINAKVAEQFVREGIAEKV